MENKLLTNITYNTSNENCDVDIEQLDKMLLKLPAEKYIELYEKIKLHIEHQILDKFEN